MATPDTVMHGCNSTIWKVETERLGTQGQPWIPSQSEASLDYETPKQNRVTTTNEKRVSANPMASKL